MHLGVDLAPTAATTHPQPVLSDADLAEVARLAPDVDAALVLAARLGGLAPLPGRGETARLWSLLASLGSVDLTVARAVEPHLDALAILGQAGLGDGVEGLGGLGSGGLGSGGLGSDERSTWGVFAAEGPGMKVQAAQGPDGWRLTGTKPWCSLADRLSHAVVTAHTPTGRRAFAVALGSGVDTDGGSWVSRGLSAVRSVATTFDDVPAIPVGPDGWYLSRPGFAWGGIGVAACWYGGAVGLARTLRELATRREPDQIALMHLGAVDARLHGARSALAEAATLVDAGAAEGLQGSLLAARVRAVVAGAVEDVLARVAHAAGPGPLTADEEHARRVADLGVYVRQHHAERDEARLAQDLLAQDLLGSDGWGW